MKKSIIIVIVLIIIGGAVWMFGSKAPATPVEQTDTTPSTSAQVSETTKVSDKLNEYKNDELGFSVKYPVAWDKTNFDTGVFFSIPTGKADTNTISKLETRISVSSGKCAFPPVTTVKDRSTITSGSLTFNTISMSNSVKGTNYFDRMYSLQKDSICYIFTFSSISINPANKGVKGSEATVLANNNKAIIDSAEQAFTAMVKSFAYVTTPAGKDEASVVPTKK